MKILLQLSGLFVGVFIRTWLPYTRKLKQGKVKFFDKKYLKTALSSIFLSVISVLIILPQYKEVEIEVIDFWTGLKVFATAFAFGFSCNTLINEFSRYGDQPVGGEK